MTKTLLFLGLLLSVFLIGCGSFTSAPAPEIESRVFSNQISEGLAGEGFSLDAPAVAPAPLGAPQMDEFIPPQSKSFGDDANTDRGAFAQAAPATADAPSPSAGPGKEPGTGGGESSLQLAQRRVISTASITIEVEEVQVASVEVRRIAENLGGFVEHLSSSGGSGGASSQRASITIRVPQDRFFTAVERLMALGEVQNQNQGSEDVSSQFIDLEAQLHSAQRREQSLLSLLEKAEKLNDILTLEGQLNRVRTEIERLQGQLNFLERRVAMATISVFLTPPPLTLQQPPSGSLAIESANVTGRVAELRSKISSVGGEVDRVFLSEREKRERAEISLRVYPEDFAQTVEFLESLGAVLSKELRESSSVDGTEHARPEEPNARIELILSMPQPPSGSLAVEAGDVTRRLNELRSQVASLGGKVDQVFLSERENREQAVVTFRVFPEDFVQTVEFLGSLGVVLSKELREGSAVDWAAEHKPQEPNARIEVTLAEKQGGNTGLILGIGTPIVLFLAGLLGLGGYLAYRFGRRRASAA